MADKQTSEQTDPFANLTAEPTDALFVGGGRPAKPVPASVVALVAQSYKSGGDSITTLRVPVRDKATADALAKELRRAGAQHDPVLTVRVTNETDNGKADGKVVAVRFKAGPKVTRKAANATPAENANAA